MSDMNITITIKITITIIITMIRIKLKQPFVEEKSVPEIFPHMANDVD